MLTAETSRLGFWIMSWASFMYSAKVGPAVQLAEVREDLVADDAQHLGSASVSA